MITKTSPNNRIQADGNKLPPLIQGRCPALVTIDGRNARRYYRSDDPRLPEHRLQAHFRARQAKAGCQPRSCDGANGSLPFLTRWSH